MFNGCGPVSYIRQYWECSCTNEEPGNSEGKFCYLISQNNCQAYTRSHVSKRAASKAWVSFHQKGFTDHSFSIFSFLIAIKRCALPRTIKKKKHTIGITGKEVSIASFYDTVKCSSTPKTKIFFYFLLEATITKTQDLQVINVFEKYATEINPIKVSQI